MSQENWQNRVTRLLRTDKGLDLADLILRNSEATARLSAISAPFLIRDLYPGTALDFVDRLYSKIQTEPHPQLVMITGLPFSGKSEVTNWIRDILTYRINLSGDFGYIGEVSWDGVKKMLVNSPQSGLIDDNNKYTRSGMIEANRVLHYMINKVRGFPNCRVVLVDTPLYFAPLERMHAMSVLKTAVREDFGRPNSHHIELVAGVRLSQDMVFYRDEPRAASNLFEATKKRTSVHAVPPLSESDLEALTVGANQSIRDNSVAEAVSMLLDNPNPTVGDWNKILSSQAKEPENRIERFQIFEEAWNALQYSHASLPTPHQVRFRTWLATERLPIVAHTNLIQIRARNQLVGYNEKPLKT